MFLSLDIRYPDYTLGGDRDDGNYISNLLTLLGER